MTTKGGPAKCGGRAFLLGELLGIGGPGRACSFKADPDPPALHQRHLRPIGVAPPSSIMRETGG